MEKEAQKKIIGRKKGVVVSKKKEKTIVVAVASFKTDKKYKKKFKFTKKYAVHDGENKYKTGDLLEIIPCRPMSKNKFYKAA